MRSAHLLAVALMVLGSACADATSSPAFTTTSTFPAVLPEPRACEAPVDTPIDVDGEPPWRQFADYLPWTDRNGCLIRVDVLAERPGPAQCEWESTRVIISGIPLGVLYTGTTDSVTFVRDPGGLYGDAALADGFQILEELPVDAIDTNYRQDERELWLAPSDPGGIYLRSPAGVERWPQGQVPVCD